MSNNKKRKTKSLKAIGIHCKNIKMFTEATQK